MNLTTDCLEYLDGVPFLRITGQEVRCCQARQSRANNGNSDLPPGGTVIHLSLTLSREVEGEESGGEGLSDLENFPLLVHSCYLHLRFG